MRRNCYLSLSLPLAIREAKSRADGERALAGYGVAASEVRGVCG